MPNDIRLLADELELRWLDIVQFSLWFLTRFVLPSQVYRKGRLTRKRALHALCQEAGNGDLGTPCQVTS